MRHYNKKIHRNCQFPTKTEQRRCVLHERLRNAVVLERTFDENGVEEFEICRRTLQQIVRNRENIIPIGWEYGFCGVWSFVMSDSNIAKLKFSVLPSDGGNSIRMRVRYHLAGALGKREWSVDQDFSKDAHRNWIIGKVYAEILHQYACWTKYQRKDIYWC